MGPNFRISSSRPHRLFFRWNGRKIGVKRVKRRPRQSYLLSLAHTPNTNEQKQGNTKKRKSRKSLQERRKWCNQKNNLPISSSPPSPQKLLQAPNTLKQLPDVLLHLQLLRTWKPARKHVDQQHANVQWQSIASRAEVATPLDMKPLI